MVCGRACHLLTQSVGRAKKLKRLLQAFWVSQHAQEKMANDLALIGTVLYGEREVHPSNLQKFAICHILSPGEL